MAEAAANAVTVSPLPGTPDASPKTQISFLGGRGTKVLKIDVVGSKTNYHAGRIEAYSTGTGESFLPLRRFAAGETVAVYALVRTGSGATRNVGTTFRIANPAAPPPGAPHGVERLTQDGTAWVGALYPIRMNLSRRGGARDGVLNDSVIEEIDLKTGLVMWQWHAFGHIPLSASRIPLPHTTRPWDYVDVRSIHPMGDGDILLRASGSDEPLYEVSIRTGAVRR